jgi:hypothetical protein
VGRELISEGYDSPPTLFHININRKLTLLQFTVVLIIRIKSVLR